MKLMRVSVWPVAIPPGSPGLLHRNVCPAPGLLQNRKCPGGGPKNDDVPGPGICINFLSNMKIVNTVICAEDSECYIKLLVCTKPIN